MRLISAWDRFRMRNQRLKSKTSRKCVENAREWIWIALTSTAACTSPLAIFSITEFNCCPSLCRLFSWPNSLLISASNAVSTVHFTGVAAPSPRWDCDCDGNCSRGGISSSKYHDVLGDCDTASWCVIGQVSSGIGCCCPISASLHFFKYIFILDLLFLKSLRDRPSVLPPLPTPAAPMTVSTSFELITTISLNAVAVGTTAAAVAVDAPAGTSSCCAVTEAGDATELTAANGSVVDLHDSSSYERTDGFVVVGVIWKWKNRNIKSTELMAFSQH